MTHEKFELIKNLTFYPLLSLVLTKLLKASEHIHKNQEKKHNIHYLDPAHFHSGEK